MFSIEVVSIHGGTDVIKYDKASSLKAARVKAIKLSTIFNESGYSKQASCVNTQSVWVEKKYKNGDYFQEQYQNGILVYKNLERGCF